MAGQSSNKLTKELIFSTLKAQLLLRLLYISMTLTLHKRLLVSKKIGMFTTKRLIVNIALGIKEDFAWWMAEPCKDLVVSTSILEHS